MNISSQTQTYTHIQQYTLLHTYRSLSAVNLQSLDRSDGRLHLGDGDGQHAVAEGGLDAVHIHVRRQTDGSLHLAISVLHGMHLVRAGLVYVLSLGLDSQRLALHSQLQIFRVHTRQVCMNVELGVRLNEVCSKNWCQ